MEEPLAIGAVLATLGLLLALAAMASPLSTRLGVPALLVFLGLGIAAGSDCSEAKPARRREALLSGLSGDVERPGRAPAGGQPGERG